jgi:hypothetical protein
MYQQEDHQQEDQEDQEDPEDQQAPEDRPDTPLRRHNPDHPRHHNPSQQDQATPA